MAEKGRAILIHGLLGDKLEEMLYINCQTVFLFNISKISGETQTCSCGRREEHMWRSRTAHAFINPTFMTAVIICMHNFNGMTLSFSGFVTAIIFSVFFPIM